MSSPPSALSPNLRARLAAGRSAALASGRQPDSEREGNRVSVFIALCKIQNTLIANTDGIGEKTLNALEGQTFVLTAGTAGRHLPPEHSAGSLGH